MRADTGKVIFYNVMVPKNKIIREESADRTGVVRESENSVFSAPLRCRRRIPETAVFFERVLPITQDRPGARARVWCADEYLSISKASTNFFDICPRQASAILGFVPSHRLEKLLQRKNTLVTALARGVRISALLLALAASNPVAAARGDCARAEPGIAHSPARSHLHARPRPALGPGHCPRRPFDPRGRLRRGHPRAEDRNHPRDRPARAPRDARSDRQPCPLHRGWPVLASRPSARCQHHGRRHEARRPVRAGAPAGRLDSGRGLELRLSRSTQGGIPQGDSRPHQPSSPHSAHVRNGARSLGQQRGAAARGHHPRHAQPRGWRDRARRPPANPPAG